MLVNFALTGNNGTEVVVCYDPATKSIFQVVLAEILFGNTNQHPSIDYQLSGDAHPVEVVHGNVEESLRYYYEYSEDKLLRIENEEVEVSDEGVTRIWFDAQFTGESFFFRFSEVSPSQNIYQ